MNKVSPSALAIDTVGTSKNRAVVFETKNGPSTKIGNMKSFRTIELEAVPYGLDDDPTDHVKETIVRLDSNWAIPPGSPSLKYWDAIVIIALIYTAVLTPYEISFLTEDPVFGNRFIINRIVDSIFALDIMIMFFRSYNDGKKFVHKLSKIARHYVEHGFFVDIISTFPFSLCARFFEGSLMSDLSMVRFIRLMRLMKLLRITKISRFYERLESSTSISYYWTSVVKFAGLIFIVSHWIACTWRLCVQFEDQHAGETWLFISGFTDEAPEATYIYCLYFAVTTITTIGYGDAANPSTTAERMLALLLMVVGGTIWAYILGTICSLVATVEAKQSEQRKTMHMLNSFMIAEKLPREMQIRVRKYFVRKRQLPHYKTSILEMMSVQMRGEVTMVMFKPWLQKVNWLQECSESFMASLALQMTIELYAPREVILSDMDLHVMRIGVAFCGMQVCVSGSVWGGDCILNNADLRKKNSVRCIGYCEVYRLSNTILMSLLGSYPEDRKRVRLAICFLALKRGVIELAKDLLNSMVATVNIVAKWCEVIGERAVCHEMDEFVKTNADTRYGGCLPKKLLVWLKDNTGYLGDTDILNAAANFYGFWDKTPGKDIKTPRSTNEEAYVHSAVYLSEYMDAFRPTIQSASPSKDVLAAMAGGRRISSMRMEHGGVSTMYGKTIKEDSSVNRGRDSISGIAFSVGENSSKLCVKLRQHKSRIHSMAGKTRRYKKFFGNFATGSQKDLDIHENKPLSGMLPMLAGAGKLTDGFSANLLKDHEERLLKSVTEALDKRDNALHGRLERIEQAILKVSFASSNVAARNAKTLEFNAP